MEIIQTHLHYYLGREFARTLIGLRRLGETSRFTIIPDLGCAVGRFCSTGWRGSFEARRKDPISVRWVFNRIAATVTDVSSRFRGKRSGAHIGWEITEDRFGLLVGLRLQVRVLNGRMGEKNNWCKLLPIVCL